MANPIDPTISSESGKYVNLSGLQAFYDELKKKTSADLDFNLTSDHPIANSAISKYIAMQGSDMASLSGAASSGSAASAWIEAFTGEGGVVTNLTVENLSGQNVTADNLTSTSATITTISSTNISGDNVTASSISASTARGESAKFDNISSTNLTSTNISSTAISATNLTALTASGTSAIFTGISAQSITGDLVGTADAAKKLATARTIAATGHGTWSVSFDGSNDVTGNLQITNVPWSAMTNVSASGVDATTTSGFVTPKQVNDAITASMSEKAAFKGPYSAKSEIPSEELDHLSIYLVGPTGTGPDVYEEYILPKTGTTTAHLLQIGDTSTDLTDYMKTSSFTDWRDSTNSLFSGTSRSANSAGSATTAQYTQNVGEGNTAQNATDVITSASAGSAAYDWVTAHAKQTITGVTTANGKNASLGITESTSTSGTSITLNASGYKTTFTTGDWVTGTTANTYDINYGLTQSAITYMQEGHAASAAVSSLINGNTISAEKIIANDGFSGTNISGANGTTSTIDDLIGSAQSGQSALNWITANSGNMGLTPYTSEDIVNGIKW